jgi:hypothetical protein
MSNQRPMAFLLPAAIVAVLVFTASTALAKKPPQPSGDPDLVGVSIALKTGCNATTCSVRNFTLTVKNQGSNWARNGIVEFYLSDDTSLSTETDTLFHYVSLGSVKPNGTKKKTVGGGLLKPFASSGKYIIANIDASDSVVESDETNNEFASDPLP